MSQIATAFSVQLNLQVKSNLPWCSKISFKIPGVYKDKIQPVGIKLTSDGKYAFVALGPANHVAVVDAKTYEVIKYLLVGKRVWQLDLANNETKLYTTNGVSGDVSIIDVETLKTEKTITTFAIRKTWENPPTHQNIKTKYKNTETSRLENTHSHTPICLDILFIDKPTLLFDASRR